MYFFHSLALCHQHIYVFFSFSYWVILVLFTQEQSSVLQGHSSDISQCFFWGDQRDSVQAVINFAKRNRLPLQMQEQMLAHMRLKFRTESLEQHETLASLPKALRAAISQHLFLPTVQQVYLFQGTSYNFLCQLVSVESSLL